ncbi:hypothetical protein [Caryophanon tenue]|uniref:Group-specific protein n=1 Tax=Caryophanon tenue TaxID=33978 RepID=A0A1C0Y825_9BACL|nr:hypothetical protein [Caryophanon tenue]OCS83300.1 hypothetical protein A6M13_04555 [Caryophanon tenue]
MYKDLSSGIKSSITRSINISLESYFAEIEWDENRFSMEDVVTYWRKYSEENAAWFDKVSEEVRGSQAFHEELARKINDSLEKMLNEQPTAEQVEALEALQKEHGTNYDYGCKAEAAFIEQKLRAR